VSRRPTLKILAGVLLVFLVSCSSGPIRMDISKDHLKVIPPDGKIPLKVGLYLSPAFRDTQTPLFIGRTQFGGIYVGMALTDATERMVRGLFEEVVVLDRMGDPRNSNSHGCDVVVTAEVKSFYFRHVPKLYTAKWATQNVVVWSVISPEGKEIYHNEIASDEVRISWLDPKNPEAVERIFNEQLKRAGNDLYTNGWWLTQWWKEMN
jgi:hypothetical protein